MALRVLDRTHHRRHQTLGEFAILRQHPFELRTLIDSKHCIFDDLSADRMRGGSLETEEVSLQVKGVDLAPPVFEKLRRSIGPRDHFIKMRGSRAFGKDSLPSGEACRNIDKGRGAILDNCARKACLA